MQLAFLIDAHQNANQKPIGSAPAYRAQCTLPPQPIFRGSGSKTTPPMGALSLDYGISMHTNMLKSKSCMDLKKLNTDLEIE